MPRTRRTTRKKTEAEKEIERRLFDSSRAEPTVRPLQEPPAVVRPETLKANEFRHSDGRVIAIVEEGDNVSVEMEGFRASILSPRSFAFVSHPNRIEYLRRGIFPTYGSSEEMEMMHTLSLESFNLLRLEDAHQVATHRVDEPIDQSVGQRVDEPSRKEVVLISKPIPSEPFFEEEEDIEKDINVILDVLSIASIIRVLSDSPLIGEAARFLLDSLDDAPILRQELLRQALMCRDDDESGIPFDPVLIFGYCMPEYMYARIIASIRQFGLSVKPTPLIEKMFEKMIDSVNRFDEAFGPYRSVSQLWRRCESLHFSGFSVMSLSFVHSSIETIGKKIKMYPTFFERCIQLREQPLDTRAFEKFLVEEKPVFEAIAGVAFNAFYNDFSSTPTTILFSNFVPSKSPVMVGDVIELGFHASVAIWKEHRLIPSTPNGCTQLRSDSPQDETWLDSEKMCSWHKLGSYCFACDGIPIPASRLITLDEVATLHNPHYLRTFDKTMYFYVVQTGEQYTFRRFADGAHHALKACLSPVDPRRTLHSEMKHPTPGRIHLITRKQYIVTPYYDGTVLITNEKLVPLFECRIDEEGTCLIYRISSAGVAAITTREVLIRSHLPSYASKTFYHSL